MGRKWWAVWLFLNIDGEVLVVDVMEVMVGVSVGFQFLLVFCYHN